MTELTQEQLQELKDKQEEIQKQIESATVIDMSSSARRNGPVPDYAVAPKKEEKVNRGFLGMGAKKESTQFNTNFDKWYKNNFDEKNITDGLHGNIVILTLNDFKALLEQAFNRDNL